MLHEEIPLRVMYHSAELKMLLVSLKDGLHRKSVHNSDPASVAKQLLGKVRSGTLSTARKPGHRLGRSSYRKRLHPGTVRISGQSAQWGGRQQ